MTRYPRRSCEISSNEAVARYTHLLPKLEPHHRDPFDRILVCQAIEHGLQLVTADPMMSKYPAKILAPV
jgi:PIN domain nuclease of toxin-antitoxin system